MLNIRCNGCGASVDTDDGSDPDSLLQCGCCPQDHHHGEAATATGQPCRPITITVGAVAARPAGGMN